MLLLRLELHLGLLDAVTERGERGEEEHDDDEHEGDGDHWQPRERLMPAERVLLMAASCEPGMSCVKNDARSLSSSTACCDGDCGGDCGGDCDCDRACACACAIDRARLDRTSTPDEERRTRGGASTTAPPTPAPSRWEYGEASIIHKHSTIVTTATTACSTMQHAITKMSPAFAQTALRSFQGAALLYGSRLCSVRVQTIAHALRTRAAARAACVPLAPPRHGAACLAPRICRALPAALVS